MGGPILLRLDTSSFPRHTFKAEPLCSHQPGRGMAAVRTIWEVWMFTVHVSNSGDIAELAPHLAMRYSAACHGMT